MKMQINGIILFFKGIEQSLGLPLWAILTISIACLLLVFFYGILIPISVLRVRKNLTNLIHVLGVSREEAQSYFQRQGPKYKYKT
jgi:hypothetical protein